jgi:hypothetical protein
MTVAVHGKNDLLGEAQTSPVIRANTVCASCACRRSASARFASASVFARSKIVHF